MIMAYLYVGIIMNQFDYELASFIFFEFTSLVDFVWKILKNKKIRIKRVCTIKCKM